MARAIPPPMTVHGNPYHNPAFSTEAALITHAALITDTHGMRDYQGRRISTQNPCQPRANRYKVQLHCHTTNSGGADAPAALMAAYEAAGYDAVAITDGNFLTPDPGGHGILHIPGVAETADNGTFINIDAVASRVNEVNLQTCIDAIQIDDALGGISHPWYAVVTPTIERWQGLYGYNLVEVANGYIGTLAGVVTVDESTFEELITRRANCWDVAVDGCHDISDADQFDRFWVEVMADALSVADIKDSLRHGNFYCRERGAPQITVTVDGNTITCSTGGVASKIRFIARNGLSLQFTENVTEASYTLQGWEHYVRIRVLDEASGLLRSWSQPITVLAYPTAHMRPGPGQEYAEATPQNHFYVTTVGSDDNDGLTWGTAYGTVAKALGMVAGNYSGNITIDIGAGNFSGFTIGGKKPTGSFTISLRGTMSTVASLVSDGAGHIGATNTKARIRRTGMAAGAYDRLMVRFTSGANNGLRRVIESNDANDITLAGKALSAAPANGDTFDILDWDTEISSMSVRSQQAGIILEDLSIVPAVNVTPLSCAAYSFVRSQHCYFRSTGIQAGIHLTTSDIVLTDSLIVADELGMIVTAMSNVVVVGGLISGAGVLHGIRVMTNSSFGSSGLIINNFDSCLETYGGAASVLWSADVYTFFQRGIAYGIRATQHAGVRTFGCVAYSLCGANESAHAASFGWIGV